MEHPDDAAVYRMPSGDRMIVTVDLIAPIVNDPRTFGKVACANSVSDVYAMGGRPLTALNIVCFPTKSLPYEVLHEVIAGSMEILREANCPLLGGHTVADEEFKFGFSVTGIVEGGETWSIDRAQVGHVLVLTKPIGTGVVNKGIKSGKLEDDSPLVLEAMRSMVALNARGAVAGRAAKASACTDITGFGLAGHAAQFAKASKVTFELHRDAVPTFEGIRKLIAGGTVAGRAKENWSAYKGRIGGELSENDGLLLFDPQTSGGLLLAIPESEVSTFKKALSDWELGAHVIGRVLPRQAHDLVVK